jgi:hypothetical protein
MILSLVTSLIIHLSVASGDGWWMTEPVSLIQTNLRETDSDLDPIALVKEIKEFPANTILFSVGGITAHYPTEVDFHYRSDYLPPGKDLVGDVINEAHKNNIRVIGRFDFSRTRKDVYDAHPEWFFKKKDDSPVFDDNGLYSICINGDYYNKKALEILTEALERYEVDGLFFNWFGNISSDYHGRYIGLCHCDVCETRFQQEYGRPIPDNSDKEYREFIFQSAVSVAKKFSDLIHEKRPKALFMTYIEEHTDGIVSEADFYKWRPLPQWIYSSSQHVNRALNTKPDKMAFNLVMPYQEMRYRFGSTAGMGLRALLYQNMAHGAFPAFVVLGTPDQPDKTAQIAVKPVFKFYKKHQDKYVGQKSSARVILYARQDPNWSSHNRDYRGFFRLLSELHIPFKVTNRIDNLDPKNIDLVVVPSGSTPRELESYIRKGGSILIAGTTHPGLTFEKTVKHWEDAKSTYMRIEDHTLFPSLKNTWVLFWEGDYLELEPSPTPVTLIPPGQFGPPDKVATLEEVTDKPGLILKNLGNGKIAFIPWHIGDLYYQHSNDKHRMFISDLVDHLVPERQLVTDAHPAVEITIMKQSKTNQTMLHLINLSGHTGTAFFEAVEMRDISISLKGNYPRAATIDGMESISLSKSGAYTNFTIDKLDEYLVICLED